MMPHYDKADLKGKRVLLRVDINSPIKNGKVHNDSRIRAHAMTVKELSDKGAMVIVIAHQGRMGEQDFTSLKEHASILEKYSKAKVSFIDDIIGQKAQEKIKSMKPGEVILLENVRYLKEETAEKSAKEHSKSPLVKTLSALADFYVNDAFSCSHRAHASIVGFPYVMKSFAGSVTKSEVEGLEKIRSSGKLCLVLGGSKPDDVLDFIKHLAPKASKILLGGMVGELFLYANGADLGKKNDLFREKFSESLDEIKSVYKQHEEKFMLPVDFAVESNGLREEVAIDNVDGIPLDIGTKTADIFHDAIMDSETVLMKGPMGAYENALFLHGSRNVIKSLEKATDNGRFSIVCGGHTSSIAESFGFQPSHVSLAGGAFIKYLATGKLVGIEAIKGNF